MIQWKIALISAIVALGVTLPAAGGDKKPLISKQKNIKQAMPDGARQVAVGTLTGRVLWPANFKLPSGVGCQNVIVAALGDNPDGDTDKNGLKAPHETLKTVKATSDGQHCKYTLAAPAGTPVTFEAEVAASGASFVDRWVGTLKSGQKTTHDFQFEINTNVPK